MLAHRTLPDWSSRFMDYQPPLLLLLALISWPQPNANIFWHSSKGSNRAAHSSSILLNDETAISASFRRDDTAEILFFNIYLSLSRCATRGDYSFKKEQHVSVLTLEGRVVMPYTGYDKHIALIGHGASIGAAKLWYDQPRKHFYLLVSLQVEGADPTPETHMNIVGIDVGLRYLAVSSTTTGTCTFYSGKQLVPQANHYARLRKRLQKQGTRSATRRLIAISGRERRLKQDANHVVSKRIVDAHPHALIGLEDLTHIRERTIRRTGKKATHKQRKANATYSKWSFAELQSMIACKALRNQSMAIKVDAHYTSQACPRCGHTCDANRPNKGLLFVCQNCHYVLHADLVGSRNVTLRTLLVRQDWARTGTLSVCPDVSSNEVKAERLRRYSELRWSPDTSLRLPAVG
jgi:putative transposase